MKKIVLTLASIFCVSIGLFAQEPPQRNCGTLQHHEYLKQTRPNYEADLNQYNQAIEKYLADKAAGLSIGKSAITTITVPVVVHVVYRTASENISNTQAASQVTVLNNDFAKLNSDAIKVTQPTFSTVASGAQIRFCLAQRDPNGNPTSGVVHYSTTVTSFGTNDAVKSSATGGADPWDVTKYINIWVCNLGSQLLGYGEFPTASLSNTWGLVLHYKYTGSGGTAIAPYNLGRTGTHEFGHCFNLYHIWGDDGTACTGSDQCSDTPNQAGEHYGCFAAGSIQTDACSPTSPGVMWMNYMDYTDDACMYMFTAQQCARMEAVVNTAPWNILGSSLGCTPIYTVDAGITSILNPLNGGSTCNNNITPKITLTNAGFTTLTSAVINYKMDALATQTLNWTGSLALNSSTVLTLNSFSGLSTAAHTFSVWVTSPNGTTDQNSANNSLTSTYTIVAAPASAALPFSERFDAVTFPPTGWSKTTTNLLNATNTWSRVANTTGIPVVPTTTACAKMDNYSGSINTSGQLDALRTPALNFSSANSTLKLKFDVSHKIRSASVTDTLNVYVSTDCGGTWTKIYGKGGTQLASVAGTIVGPYTPTLDSQWRRDSISMSSYVGQSVVYIKFESRSGHGNNIYLDNVNVSNQTSTGLESLSESLPVLEVFPNPNSGVFSISISNVNNESNVYVNVLNTVGQVVSSPLNLKNSANGLYTVNLSHLSNGIYFVTIKTDSNKIVTKKIMINK